MKTEKISKSEQRAIRRDTINFFLHKAHNGELKTVKQIKDNVRQMERINYRVWETEYGKIRE